MVIVDTVGTQTDTLTTEPVGCGGQGMVVTETLSGKVVNDVVEVVLRLVVVWVTVLVSVGVGVHTVVIFSTFNSRLISSTEDRDSDPNESPICLPQWMTCRRPWVRSGGGEGRRRGGGRKEVKEVERRGGRTVAAESRKG